VGRADEAAAVETIKKLGGKVTVDAKRPGKPVVGVNLDNTTVTDAGLKELKELKTLREMHLGGTKVTDAGLKELKDSKSLQKLYRHRLARDQCFERALSGAIDLAGVENDVGHLPDEARQVKPTAQPLQWNGADVDLPQHRLQGVHDRALAAVGGTVEEKHFLEAAVGPETVTEGLLQNGNGLGVGGERRPQELQPRLARRCGVWGGR
jgi:hypothetical protein